MITVLAYWFLLFFIFLPGGLLVNKIFRLHTKNVPVLLIAGMFLTTTAFTITAFFTELGIVSCLCCVGIAIILSFYLWKEYCDVLKEFSKTIAYLPLLQKIILVILALAAALKSAQLPTIIDNESYYLQTIKWVNEYGFVKGLGNLHPFLAQMSPWHVLQAGLNLNFLTNSINDINGFLFITGMTFCFQEGRKKVSGISWIAVVPFLSVIYFFFLDSPSPDLPIIIITPIIFYLLTKQHIAIPWMLFLFMAFIKITIAPLGLLFLYRQFRTSKLLPGMMFSGLVIAAFWTAKNSIVSGYPLYPLTFIENGADWQIPKHLLSGMHISSNVAVYGVRASDPSTEKFISWLTIGSIDGFFNILMVTLLAVMPFFRKIRVNKFYRVIYLGCVVHFILLFFVSPQFRFFLPEIIFFLAFISAEALNVISAKTKLYSVGLIAATALTFCTISHFKLKHIYCTEAISAHANMQFIEVKEGNLKYFSPKENFFLYGTANGPLPCVNKAQLERFKRKYHVAPQMRGLELKDGFYSMPVASP